MIENRNIINKRGTQEVDTHTQATQPRRAHCGDARSFCGGKMQLDDDNSDYLDGDSIHEGGVYPTFEVGGLKEVE